MQSSLPSFLSFLYLIVLIEAEKLPGDITPCHKNDPDLSECVRKSMTNALLNFKNGNKEINIGSLDPLLMENVNFIHSRTAKNMQLDFKFVKAKCYGISSSVMGDAKVKPEGDKIYLQATSRGPNITVEGLYEIKGKMLLLPINARDNFRLEMYDLVSKGKLELVPEDVNGVKHYKVTNPVLTIESLTGAKTDFQNLVPGNKELSEKMNEAIQENFVALFDVYKPALNKFYSDLFTQFAERFFSKVPADEAILP